MNFNQISTNMARAVAAWGNDMPRWVTLLATACDKATQRAVADRLGNAGFNCSHGTVSKLINNKYPASTAEPERAVLAIFGGDQVICPVWGVEIPLTSCLRERRRKRGTGGSAALMYQRWCPDCEYNTDGPREAVVDSYSGLEP